MKQYSLRLKSGQDLKKEIVAFTKEHNIKSGVIISIVGSLKQATLRMAEAKTHKSWNEHLEIVSCQGTVSIHDPHIHMSVSDKNGRVWGGHVKDGCIVNSTVELVILAFDDIEYFRTQDTETGYEELDIKKL